VEQGQPLVPGAITILKNDGVKVNGFRMTSHFWKWKIKFMFETTNQTCFDEIWIFDPLNLRIAKKKG